MAYHIEDSSLATLLQLLIGENGSDPNVRNPLADALSVLLNSAMLYERERRLGAAPYKRSVDRNGQANGYKERSLSTRLGGRTGDS